MRRFSLFYLLFFLHVPALSYAGAIHDAAKDGDVVAIAAALDAGASANESEGSATPLYLAVRRGHLEAAKLLIERGADVNGANKRGPVLMAAVRKNNIDLIALLLEHGADPNAQLDGEAALHVAVKNGCLDCVKALVVAGADANAQTDEGKTPIHLAKLKGSDEIATYLLSNGVTLPKPKPVSDMMAAGDVEKGKAYFRSECWSCHSIEPDGGTKNGPNLWGVVGRARASVSQISYSEAMRAWKGDWTYEDLNTYLSGPMLTTPGVYMETLGVPDEGDRINVIVYLRTLSDNPVPLP